MNLTQCHCLPFSISIRQQCYCVLIFSFVSNSYITRINLKYIPPLYHFIFCKDSIMMHYKRLKEKPPQKKDKYFAKWSGFPANVVVNIGLEVSARCWIFKLIFGRLQLVPRIPRLCGQLGMLSLPSHGRFVSAPDWLVWRSDAMFIIC